MRSAALAALLKDDFEHQLRDNPEFASQAGDHRFDGQLQDLSPASFERRHQHNGAMLLRAQALQVEPEEELSSKERMYLKMFIDNIQMEQQALALRCHLAPVNSIGYGGVVNNFIEMLEWIEAGEAGAEKLLDRVKAFPDQCKQYIELLKAGVEKGFVASKAMLRKTSEQINDVVKQKPLNDLSDASLVEEWERACFSVEKYLRESYALHARDQAGCTGLPQGSEVYSLCLRYHTTTRMTADEIHKIGLEQVARIEERYRRDVLEPLGYSADPGDFKKTFAAFVETVRTDKSHCYDTAAELLDGYKSLCASIEKELPRFFNCFPKSKLEIVSKDAVSGPAAYYLAGTPDGTRPGRFYVNVSNIKERPKYEMEALALHEAIPGHHHQCALALENTTIPDFVRFLEDRRYEFCPARRQLYAAYLEGWALYCEALGEEMGIYKNDPLKLFGRLSMECMRAVRLVVDTGIHHQGWSVDKAIDYMMEKTGMHRHEVEAECYRYEAWPGQACAYKIGEVAIWRMRRKAETSLGEHFDIKAFHDIIINGGPLPLDLLEDQVENWITELLEPRIKKTKVEL